MEAKLTFPTLIMANEFAKAWSRKSMKGHIIVPNDSSVSVIIDGITDELKIWIDGYVIELNSKILSQ